MPRATVSHDHQRFDLKSCEGGYVVLRTLSFHEMMQRRDIASKMWTEFAQSSRKKKDTVKEDAVRAQLEVMNVATMQFDFKNSIVEHNLEDENGVLLDFNNPLSFTILDPKIGLEIDRLIESLNQEQEDDVTPLPNALTSSLQDGETKQSPSIPEVS